MKTDWKTLAARGLVLGAVTMAGLTGGCVVHSHGYVDVVDARGYSHHGYYDDGQVWHGGYYDESHTWHDDPGDWHR